MFHCHLGIATKGTTNLVEIDAMVFESDGSGQ
jgi:hypothetical protein